MSVCDKQIFHSHDPFVYIDANSKYIWFANTAFWKSQHEWLFYQVDKQLFSIVWSTDLWLDFFKSNVNIHNSSLVISKIKWVCFLSSWKWVSCLSNIWTMKKKLIDETFQKMNEYMTFIVFTMESWILCSLMRIPFLFVAFGPHSGMWYGNV